MVHSNAMDTPTRQATAVVAWRKKPMHRALKAALSLLVAIAVVQLPGALGWHLYEDLPDAGRVSLGILVLAALLWMTEAMPAFAVSLLVIGLQIGIFGRPGGVWAAEGDTKEWTRFVADWASPVMWLFLGGFVMARACTKTGLDRWLAGLLLGRLTSSPAKLLGGVMGVTFCFGMFISNTATAAMMVAVISPLIAALPHGSRLAPALLLGVALTANLGGIGTIIGTPPNAIAVEQIPEAIRPDFFGWMLMAMPPAIVLVGIMYLWLWWNIRSEPGLVIDLSEEKPADGLILQRLIVMAIFAVTVVLWMSESLLKIPPAVVSFLPIVALAVSGVIAAEDIRQLPWDVLLLLAGGLSLGTGVQVTGLAGWLAGLLPSGFPPMATATIFCVAGVLLSNLMSSNTATAAMLIPIGTGMVGPAEVPLVAIGIAVGCSAAMILPVSTPPNAIVYATGRLTTRHFLIPGILSAIGVLIIFPWLKLLGK